MTSPWWLYMQGQFSLAWVVEAVLATGHVSHIDVAASVFGRRQRQRSFIRDVSFSCHFCFVALGSIYVTAYDVVCSAGVCEWVSQLGG